MQEPYWHNFRYVDEVVFAGSIPIEQWEWGLLKRKGVTRIFFLTAATRYLSELKNQKWAKFFDFREAISQGQLNPSHLRVFMQSVIDCAAKGEKIYVHCGAGKDKTGQFIEAYLEEKKTLELPHRPPITGMGKRRPVRRRMGGRR